ncbi:N-6 DNA methylase [Limosilactobacillus ingluviei]|uniref:DNA methyltransferase n=1 Tax=Limosilactobacillus ingluviei TaxID=148604 RepID=A0A0R2GUE1_9LACO|nr:N-6 DNA methylase [Limosilactobacillus ingluviei]KRN44495.1 DNA methyltransferase [Limosilactobacillus ingluviei]
MKEKLIKSVDRVKGHGEVFTPRSVVDLMLNQPEIITKINTPQATFLEPAAGEGAFLVAILERKLKYAAEESKNAREFGNNALLVLSTLYGIELLEDNVEMLVMNMNETFANNYRELGMEFFEAEPDLKVYRSAKIIIRANMAQGDALKKVDASGNPIIFSEWQPIGKTRVQRTEYTFESIINNDGPIGTVQNQTEQLDLFAINDEPIEAQKFSEQRYAECKWTDVYKELVEYVS